MNDDIFNPTTDPSTLRLLATARKVNAERDRADREAGFDAPGDGPLDGLLRTAISAIAAGIEGRNWSAVAEGLVMLQDAEVRARTGEPGPVDDPPTETE